MATPLSFNSTDVVLITSTSAPAGSVTAESISPSVPATPSGDPIDNITPPVKSTSGAPVFTTAKASDGSVTLSTNAAPTGGNNWMGYVAAAPASRLTLNQNGTITASTLASAPAGAFTTSNFTDSVDLKVNGDITSKGQIIRDFAHGVAFDPAADPIDSITFSVPYGKSFPTPPSSAVVTITSGYNNGAITPTIMVNAVELLVFASDTPAPDSAIRVRGYVTITQ